MTDRYKSYRIVDGKARWIIVDENGNIVNRNPSKDELKILYKFPEKDGRGHLKVKRNSTHTCDRCGIDYRKSIYGPFREYIEGEPTGLIICNYCHSKDSRTRPDSHNNIIKSMRDSRTGNLNPNSTKAKGDKFEELTSRWRGIKILSKELDNHRLPYDHSIDPELGTIQTKGCLLNSKYMRWSQNFEHENNQTTKGIKFDVLVLYCASKDGKTIERIYIIPSKEILKRTGISIVQYGGWYEQYRITNEETIKKINNIWREI